MTKTAITLLAALLVGSTAYAADKPAEADKSDEGKDAKAAEEAPGAPKVNVTTILLPHPGVPDDQTVAMMRGLEDGLKKNERLTMKELDTRLAEFAQEVPTDQVTEGRQALADGLKQLNGFDFQKAIKSLTQAIDVLSKVLPHIKKQELADAMVALACAQLQIGDRKSAKVALARLFVWRPDYQLDTGKFPPLMITPVEEARREAEKAKRGSIEIKTDPVPGQAYVDGKFVGVTPAFADGLIVGEHYITIKREGYHKAVQQAVVSAKTQATVTIPLERSKKYLLVEQAIAAVNAQIGKEVIDENADNLKEVLFVDHTVFVRVKQSGKPGQLDVTAELYDLRTRHRLKQVKRVVSATSPKAMTEVAKLVYEGVNYEGDIEAPKDAPPPKPIVRRPFYKTWWFWTVAGVVVAGAVVGGVLAPKPKSCGDTNLCLAVTF